jgi:hypothetical protein
VVRVLAEDVCERLDDVLDTVLRVVAHCRQQSEAANMKASCLQADSRRMSQRSPYVGDFLRFMISRRGAANGPGFRCGDKGGLRLPITGLRRHSLRISSCRPRRHCGMRAHRFRAEAKRRCFRLWKITLNDNSRSQPGHKRPRRSRHPEQQPRGLRNDRPLRRGLRALISCNAALLETKALLRSSSFDHDWSCPLIAGQRTCRSPPRGAVAAPFLLGISSSTPRSPRHRGTPPTASSRMHNRALRSALRRPEPTVLPMPRSTRGNQTRCAQSKARHGLHAKRPVLACRQSRTVIRLLMWVT